MMDDAVEIVTEVAGFAPLEPQWRSLRQKWGCSASDSDPELFAAVVSVQGQEAEPYVAVFRDRPGGEAIAMLVAKKQRRSLTCWFSRLRLSTPRLRVLVVVYGGVIADGTANAVAAIANHLVELRDRRRVDWIELDHFPVDHPLGLLLKERLGGAVSSPRVETHWWLEMGPSWEGYLATFSKKHRYNIRRADRLLVEHFQGDVVLREFRPAEADQFVRETAQVARGTWQAQEGIGFEDTAHTRAVIGTEARHGRFRGYWLVCSGKPIAFQYGAIYDGTYVARTMGFLPEHRELSPGTVLHVRVLEHLARAGVGSVDYLFGNEEYKKVYGSRSWQEATVMIAGRTPRAWVARGMRRAASGVQALREWVRRRSVRSVHAAAKNEGGAHS